MNETTFGGSGKVVNIPVVVSGKPKMENNRHFNAVFAKALAEAKQREYEREQAEYLDALSLGSIEGLNDDAKLLIYMNPKIINDLAAAILENTRLMEQARIKYLTPEDRLPMMETREE